jgi:malate synthase
MPASPVEPDGRVLTPAAVAFVEDLTRRFRPRIAALLTRRRAAQQRLDHGERLANAPTWTTSRELEEFLTLPAYDILAEAS